jgi:hypothetical protein
MHRRLHRLLPAGARERLDAVPRPLQRRFVIPVLPSVVALVSFYTLAVHMRISLGGWPESIGERGFPPALVTHAHISQNYFGVVFIGTLFVSPLAMLVCALVKRWRRALTPLLISFVGFFACLACMQLGPARFANWWWD